MIDDRKIKAALVKDAEQIQLPPDLLRRMEQHATPPRRPGLWARMRLGPKLEIVAAFLILVAIIGLVSLRQLTQAPTPANEDPQPPASDPSVPALTCTTVPEQSPSEPDTVAVFFTCDGDPLPATPRALTRLAPDPTAKLQTALEEMLKGPTPQEQAMGFYSVFSSKTAGMLGSVTVTEEGRAIVDFADFSRLINNGSTTAGAGQLIRELNMTIFQFEEIREVEYRFGGSCDAFFGWLQNTCTVISATPSSTQVPAETEAAQVLRRFAELLTEGNVDAAAGLLAPNLRTAYQMDDYAPLRNITSMTIIRLAERTGEPNWHPDVGPRDQKAFDSRVFEAHVHYRIRGIIDSSLKDDEVHRHKVTVTRYTEDGPWLISELSGT